MGAFVGDSCRGVGSPIQHNDGWLYFITVYANGDGETVNFKAWISDTDTVLSVWEAITFTHGFSLGSPDNPYELNTYLNYDFSPIVSGIPDQLIHQDESFDGVRLYDYLELNDSDPIVWQVTGQVNLVVSLTDSIVYVSPVSGWTGAESLVFSAVDSTENGYAGSDTATYTVLPEDNHPVIAGIPDQTIGINSQFSSFNLNSFLTELDGNDVQFSYDYSEPSETDTDPLWSVNHSEYEFNMSATVLVESRGSIAEGAPHTLAAFASDGSVRGVASAVQHIDSWLYFITIYSHDAGDSISFRFFDQEHSLNLPIKESLIFSVDAILGGPDTPILFRAGFILTDIDTAGWVELTKTDPMWSGSETIMFSAQDIGTGNSFSSVDEAVFTVSQEISPILSGIPDQYLSPGESFSNIELSDYLEPYDGELSWSVSGQDDISVDLDGSLAVITSPDGWLGTESIVFTVTEIVHNLSSSDMVILQIFNSMPNLTDIADQSIDEDTVIEIELFATDDEDDSLSFGSNVLSGDISVGVSGNILTVSPAADWNGNGQIEVIAYDTYGSDTTEFALNVAPIDDQPVAVLVNDFTSMRGQEIVVDGLGSYDVDGDSLSFSWTVPQDLNITSVTSQEVRFTVPESGAASAYMFILEVDDGYTVSAPDTLVISVEEFSVNDILPSLSDLVLNIGENVVITVSIPEYFDVDSISLNYATAFSGFISSEMIDDGQRSSSYSFNIPFYMAGLEGLVYFVYVEDLLGNTIVTDTIDISLSFDQGSVTTSMLYSAHPGGLILGSWRMISIPSIVDNNLVEYIFNDQLNGGPSETGWMLYEWSSSEWVVPSEARPGQGYWIKQLEYDNHHLSLGSGSTVNLSGFDILVDPGWNQISSPYLFPVHAEIDAEIFSELFTYGNHSTEGWLDTTITTMVPWGAYAIFNQSSEPETLKLGPLDYSPRSMGRKRSTGSWSVKIGVRSGKYADLKNVFGMMGSSEHGWDSNDCPELPTVDKYLSLYSEPGNGTGVYEKLTMDFRHLDDSVQVWDLALETNMGECESNMEMRLSGDLNGNQLWMLDMQTRTPIELINGQTSHHSVNIISSNLKNRYKLVYGSSADASRIIDETFGSIPQEFSLGNNYPNPFNPETVIPFSIAEPSLVIINIYDITGREINQIVHEHLGSGFYTRKWNGQNSKGTSVSTGVYYYSIETKLFKKFKKMILLK